MPLQLELLQSWRYFSRRSPGWGYGSHRIRTRGRYFDRRQQGVYRKKERSVLCLETRAVVMFWHIVGRGTGSLSFRPAHPPLVAPILHVSRFTAEPSDSLSSASDRTGLKGTANRDALRWGSICKSRTLFGVRTAMGNGLRTGPSSTFTCSFGCCWSQVLYCFVLYVWATR